MERPDREAPDVEIEDLSWRAGLVVVALASIAAAGLRMGTSLDGMPVIYAAVVYLTGRQQWPAALVTTLAAGLYVWSDPLAAGALGSESGSIAFQQPFIKSGLLLVFAGLGHLVQRAQLRAAEDDRQQVFESYRASLLQRAREFRLLNVARPDVEAEGQRRDLSVIDAVEAVRQGVYERLYLLKRALDCHTCVVLWESNDGGAFKIRELASDSDNLVEAPIDRARGVVGSIARCREPVRLSDMRQGSRGVTYYRDSEPIDQFLGVPILEEGSLRGVLCLDRVQGAPFTDEETDVVEQMADSMLRTLQNERVFRSAEETRFELSRFFAASQRLNSVLTMEEALSAALESASEVVDFDIGAVTLRDEEGVEHEIVRVEAPEEPAYEDWEGVRFDDNSGLVSMAVKNEHYLPYQGRVRDGGTIVFDEQHALRGFQSLVVFPLITRDRAIGTLVVASRQAEVFGTRRRDMLGVIASQAAVTLQNARLYARMQALASTDELTGLPNRRQFEEALEDALVRHRRTERPFGILMADIDHFKDVNDTYGHDVGDRVLEQISATLRASVRGADMPARWGGEEFIVLLEEADLDDVLTVAQRVRRNVAALAFPTEGETLQCTVSLGAAVWPEDGSDEEVLIRRADEALYHSKENGRDQVTPWNQIDT
jgi:diguanylate cyclase (GGDEF)-like protein